MSTAYPHNRETERVLLASLVARPARLDDVDLEPRHLYDPGHAHLLAALRRMRADGISIDLVTVADLVARDPHPERYGGLDYVMTMLDGGAPGALPSYVRQVRADAARRQIREIADEATSRASTEDPRELVAELRRRLDEVDAGGDDARWHPIADCCDDAVEHIWAVRDQEIQPAISTGLWRLDDMLSGGFAPSDLVILAARPSMGKTALALQMADAVVMQGQPVGFVSAEMSRQQLATRMLSRDSRISSSDLRQGQVTDAGLSTLCEWAAMRRGSPLWIDDRGGQSVAEVAAQARRLDRMARAAGHRDGLRMLVVDYLQLLDLEIGRGDTRAGAVGDGSRALKALAKSLDCTVLALSQLSRRCEERTNKRPIMADLRDSGAIEQDADVVVFIYREDRYSENVSPYVRDVAELIVSKHRNGPIGTVPAHWRATTTEFGDMSDESARLWERERKA